MYNIYAYMKEGIGWEKFCEFVLIPVLSIFLELTAATPFDNPLDSQSLLHSFLTNTSLTQQQPPLCCLFFWGLHYFLQVRVPAPPASINGWGPVATGYTRSWR